MPMTNKTTSAIDRDALCTIALAAAQLRDLSYRDLADETREAHNTLADTITRLQAALKPFVRHYEFKWMDERPDDAECCIYSRVTYGQLREAVAALRSSVGGE